MPNVQANNILKKWQQTNLIFLGVKNKTWKDWPRAEPLGLTPGRGKSHDSLPGDDKHLTSRMKVTVTIIYLEKPDQGGKV